MFEVTPQWVAKRYQRWGKDSPLYQARVLGQFPEQGDDTLIPLSWIEAAVKEGVGTRGAYRTRGRASQGMDRIRVCGF